MEKEDLLTALQQEIGCFPYDLKAEAMLTLALEKGLREEDFVMASESGANRPYSKDVLNSVLEIDAGRGSYLQLNLSRNGWYDQLPEGLFHQPEKSGVPVLSADKMAAAYVKNRQIEQECKQFFRPFEQAFYDAGIQLESEELTLLKGLNTGKLNDFFIEFWGIKPTFPSKFITPFVELLPVVHKLNGNPDQIAQCLESMIHEAVEVRRETQFSLVREDEQCNNLGVGHLGLDLLLGNQFLEESSQYRFLIGPLTQSRVEDYLEKGSHYALLKVFYDYFLPVEADGFTQIIFSAGDMNYSLDPQTPPILGYTFCLAA